ncbi:DUF2945 domain-containing protein [Bdellovibrio sp. KM01]|uniref:DUF2945 domain-containing protein n=1 Tax=Bdellovibrio sp. KM01 TaxID=2748865 RepID=UPI0015E95956|nr:DUF2945 domain-containing protein [Bdellovibrio sp. KM01]QLY25259.1 DUF2945 domain-containing protein [Bdellovibrio sp. KM01]
MAAFKKNENVQWKYLGRPIHGKVEEVFFESITKTIKGKKITRNGSKEKPAYLVKSEAGNIALKLETELEKGQKSSAKTPRMFAKD